VAVTSECIVPISYQYNAQVTVTTQWFKSYSCGNLATSGSVSYVLSNGVECDVGVFGGSSDSFYLLTSATHMLEQVFLLTLSNSMTAHATGISTTHSITCSMYCNSHVLLDGSVSVRAGGAIGGVSSSSSSITAYNASLTATSRTTARREIIDYGFSASTFGGWRLNVLISSTLSQYNQYIAMFIKRDATRSSSSVYGGYVGEYSNALSFTTSRYCSLAMSLYAASTMTSTYISTNISTISGFASTSGGTNSSLVSWGPNVMDYKYYNEFRVTTSYSVFPTSLTIVPVTNVDGPVIYIY
jgi:hypothetical protein